ncbi:MAG: acylneuraminate cytidylyltransferase family protein [Desulfovibrio sp.]|nr:acylneuraminate cytidylyltransferase family protein [Desulfovibrio sp.]
MSTSATVCIIPARGGSKRIPRKNLLPLNGKPLLAHTVEAVLKARVFAEVYVSSDDPEILALAETCGARADVRPQHLAGDTVKAVEIISEFLSRPGHAHRYDVVGMCLPTCPLRVAQDVREAMERFARHREQCPRLIGVTRYEFPPQLALRSLPSTPGGQPGQPGQIGQTGQIMDMREPEAYQFSTRSQEIEPLYYPNGSIYLSTVANYLQEHTFFGRPTLVHVMPPERSFDIDYPYQFTVVEQFMRQLHTTPEVQEVDA